MPPVATLGERREAERRAAEAEAEGEDDGPQGAGHPEDGDEEDALFETVIVEGELGQLSMSIGGKRPTESTISLQGGAKYLPGQFEKGDVVEFTVTARVAGVHVDDTVDTVTGDVSKTTRKHVAKIVKIEHKAKR